MPMIGAAYLRCSDPRQDKSIDQQRDEITRRAQADGVIIPPENWFIDEGISGRTAKKRKAYQDLLRAAEAQAPRVVTPVAVTPSPTVAIRGLARDASSRAWSRPSSRSQPGLGSSARWHRV